MQDFKNRLSLLTALTAGFVAVIGSALGGLTLRAQSAPPLKFEVASIRPAPDARSVIMAGGIPHSGTKIDGARVDIGSTNLRLLVMTAYGVRSQQISGPDWMASQRFDVLATMPAGATKEQLPEMLQALLAERFKLIARRVAREQDVFALVVGKGGLKMETAAADADFSASKEPLFKGTPGNAEGLSGTINGPDGPMKLTVSDGGKWQHFEFARATAKGLADGLTTMLGKPVLDRTGLDGTYHAVMDIMSADTVDGARILQSAAGPANSPADAASEPGGDSIFKAVEKLGLKLEPRKAPVEYIVIDHLEKTPTEN
jgi:uncharacterized protein (TIGR03435 family)